MAKVAEKKEHEESLAGWSWLNLRGDGEGGEISSHVEGSFRTSTTSVPALSSVGGRLRCVLPSVREQRGFHDETAREIEVKHQGNGQPKGQLGTGVKSVGSVEEQVKQVYVILRQI